MEQNNGENIMWKNKTASNYATKILKTRNEIKDLLSQEIDLKAKLKKISVKIPKLKNNDKKLNKDFQKYINKNERLKTL